MSQRALLKLVDKYQFNEKNSLIVDGVEQYEATHIETRELITIKRISTKTQKEQSNRILNQLSILKKLNHFSIPKCHKLLKTSNNIYLIFERISGQPLRKRLVQQVNSSNCKDKYEQTIRVAQNLGNLLKYLQEVKVCHSSISDVNILIDSSSKIKIANFSYAEELHDSTSLRKFQGKAQESRFKAPEELNGIICDKTDVYMAGMVLREVFMGLKKQIQSSHSKEKEILEKISFILKFLQEATKSEVEDRISSEEFNHFFSSKQFQRKNSPQKFQLILTDPKEKIGKQLSVNEKSLSTQKLPSQVSSLSRLKSLPSLEIGSQTQQYLYIARKVLNRRNFSELLLEISSFCLRAKQVSYSRRIPLSFLLLKKSTLLVTQLAKFIETGRGGGLTMNEKIKEKLAKHRLYHNMQATVHKQMNYLRDRFLKSAEAVKELQKTYNNPYLNKQLQKQQISEEYLRTVIASFLDEFISWHNNDDNKGQNLRISETINQKSLSLLFILSLIGEIQSFQKIYETFFSESGCELWNESFLAMLTNLPAQDLQSLVIAQMKLKIDKNLDNSNLGSDSPSRLSHFSSYQKL